MPRESQWWVVCLCAGWCGVCREYQPLFDALAAQHPGTRFLWVDVEDEADVVGDLDIETFPTLLIADGSGPRFVSPLAPHIAVLDRLIESLREQAQAGQHAVLDAEVQALWRAISGKLA